MFNYKKKCITKHLLATVAVLFGLATGGQDLNSNTFSSFSTSVDVFVSCSSFDSLSSNNKEYSNKTSTLFIQTFFKKVIILH